jgi:hypothetical protein
MSNANFAYIIDKKENKILVCQFLWNHKLSLLELFIIKYTIVRIWHLIYFWYNIIWKRRFIFENKQFSMNAVLFNLLFLFLFLFLFLEDIDPIILSNYIILIKNVLVKFYLISIKERASLVIIT